MSNTQSKIRCLIADDEPHALKLMQSYVEKTPFIEALAYCKNARECYDQLQANPEIELAFLDIQMPGMSGMELVKSLEKPPLVVFTTAFEKYAIDGYKVNAIDYLLKPFSYDEFLSAAQKAAKTLADNSQDSPDLKIDDDFIIIKADYKIWQIPVNDIQYIEGVRDYVKIHRSGDSKTLMPLLSLKSLENKLPPYFMRVNRSYIINTKKIEVIERGQVIFGDTRITVSDNYKNDFQRYLDDRFVN